VTKPLPRTRRPALEYPCPDRPWRPRGGRPRSTPDPSVSKPTVICGSNRRSLENPGSRNPSPSSVAKYSVVTSYSSNVAGPSRTCSAQARAIRARHRPPSASAADAGCPASGSSPPRPERTPTAVQMGRLAVIDHQDRAVVLSGPLQRVALAVLLAMRARWCRWST
jgi:hypothetical protein